MKRGEIWWADLGAHRPREQTGRRPVIVRRSDALTGVLQSVLVVPLTTNMDVPDSRARRSSRQRRSVQHPTRLRSRFRCAPFLRRRLTRSCAP
ncbi:MAG: type II toxin-antitoxin system PemK/MazF family toxin [Myxococcales bacterium]|nr:type II toxin-antitoxin system PemK/MazF family toxin [Myxococcales bacterium]